MRQPVSFRAAVGDRRHYTFAMTIRPFDARKLDMDAFSAAAGKLSGEWPLGSMERVAALVPSEAAAALEQPVRWSMHGERRPARGLPAEVWLHLAANANLALECQRCLQPVTVPLEIERSFRFVHDEDEAEALDAESEDDVLVLERTLDSQQLVEDELLLSLPVVALHDECPDPLPLPADEFDDEEEEPENPFAALAVLKRDPGEGGEPGSGGSSGSGAKGGPLPS